MTAATDRVRAQVHRVLAQFVDGLVAAVDGEATFPYGSALVHVRVVPFDEDGAAVRIEADVVRGVTPTAELYEFVATSDHEVGHLRVVPEDGAATVSLRFAHSVLADHLTDDEIRLIVVAMAFTADAIDDELAGRFGGTRAREA